jgi:alanyl-tRNA synthetase
MDAAALRKSFLDYFSAHEHKVVPSSPLVPGNDPTLLFTNAGMVQFKDVFLGMEKRSYSRATSSQRCVRAGGKHNDLENVGYTARHHTFFEMLGNFSFGDYFKEDAIRYGWDFLTNTLGLPPERLWVTVYQDDDEAADIWIKQIGVDPDRLSRLGEKDNFWSMGDTGPCGPCSEIFYDHGPDVPGGPPGSPDEDGDRYVEIWNLVFMQFDRAADGTLTNLPKPSVDTGMGLERVAAVMQGVHSNYEIDLFQALIQATAQAVEITDLAENSLKVIADHIRACSFLIVDGVLPGNEGRGYVLRRIIRRALRHGHKLGQNDPFFYKLVRPLVKEMGKAYPELAEARAHVEKVLLAEEEKFSLTLASGMKLLSGEASQTLPALRKLQAELGGEIGLGWVSQDGSGLDGTLILKDQKIAVEVVHLNEISFAYFEAKLHSFQAMHEQSAEFSQLYFLGVDIPADYRVDAETRGIFAASGIEVHSRFYTSDMLAPARIVPGAMAFKLFDTYGFPLDLTVDAARDLGYQVDMDGFEQAMNEQRSRSRAASKFAAIGGDALLAGETSFIGYDTLNDACRIEAIYAGGESVSSLAEGQECQIILAQTPFYAESGGQVGDIGTLNSRDSHFNVTATVKNGAVHVHVGLMTTGSVAVGDVLADGVDKEKRSATELNHSATHLLHAALREVLGTHVAQKGSLVSPDRLRFDFSHYEGVTPAELRAIENRVNEEIRVNHAAETRVMSFDEARESGAVALFGEKYGDEVRVLSVGEFSVELCGGTHVQRAGDIGVFKILSEGGIASGVRRIEAATGARAIECIHLDEQRFDEIAGLLRTARSEVGDKARQLVDRNKELERELKVLRGKLAGAAGQDLAAGAKEIGGIKVLAIRLDDDTDAGALRDTVDRMKDKLGTAVVVLGAATTDGKVRLAAGVTKDAVDRVRAGDLVREIAEQVGGKGGGRPDFAQAGGSDPGALDAALASVAGWVEQRIA